MTTRHEMKAGDRTLSRAAGMVANARGDFDRLSRTLADTIVGYQGAWQGQGGRAFFNLHRAWTERQDRIVRALDDFETALTSTERDNIATDQSQSDNLARTHSRLDGVKQY
jgi:WXG100 family type VII secretion target